MTRAATLAELVALRDEIDRLLRRHVWSFYFWQHGATTVPPPPYTFAATTGYRP